ncbi:transcription/translation regulatory transformer protein RfaH [Shewanella avicenniae]|uniref:Transcription antitermination protein RfaH n=1 Tax=Shewanella avicenniae TaxID=2814294 RepID=A0ABX7QMV6_9GAMM|nr:transcription/translation regulatory transformer protein RfaH [Shewanella avicenniae]QSX32694.1 transcription/translation regulatory transformer protein RfaH [Shewanella avicenniae]
MKGWYLLYCKPKSEQRAQLNLGMQGLETYLPMIKVEKQEKGLSVVKKSPLFPNYLFVNFDPADFSVAKIHSTRGVSRLVDCKEQPIPLNDILITQLKRQELTAPVTVDNSLVAGDKVRFIAGPFRELQGVFLERNSQQRCKVLFEILGKMQSIDYALSDVERVSA